MNIPEFAQNPESRCPVVLVLDTSASMKGAPIDALNRGISRFKYDVEQDAIASMRVEISIVSFGSSVDVVQDFVTIDDFSPPVLEASGKTPLGQGVRMGFQQLTRRCSLFKEAGVGFYRPWMFLVTDGAPTDGNLWKEVVEDVRVAVEEQKMLFFTVGVEGADLRILRAIAPKSSPPILLQDMRFEELFSWLSVSVCQMSRSSGGENTLYKLPPVDNWGVQQ
ncbi:MAG: VWA domain-containing protein [Alphaproteobacteria bacterium]|nr:VWA domain-containing protein [Alphaproteobacteria bacterium]